MSIFTCLSSLPRPVISGRAGCSRGRRSCPARPRVRVLVGAQVATTRRPRPRDLSLRPQPVPADEPGPHRPCCPSTRARTSPRGPPRRPVLARATSTPVRTTVPAAIRSRPPPRAWVAHRRRVRPVRRPPVPAPPHGGYTSRLMDHRRAQDTHDPPTTAASRFVAAGPRCAPRFRLVHLDYFIQKPGRATLWIGTASSAPPARSRSGRAPGRPLLATLGRPSFEGVHQHSARFLGRHRRHRRRHR